MNKNDWQKVLSKELKSLPDDERRRICEYYDELFEDRADAGQKEAEILQALGDPKAAAEKILSDYDAYLKRSDEPVEPSEPESPKTPDNGEDGLKRGDERTFESAIDIPGDDDYSDDDESLENEGTDDFDGDVYTEDTNKKFASVRKLKIDVTVPVVEIVRADKFSLKLEQNKDARFDVDVAGETLYIKERAKSFGAVFKNFLGLSKKAVRIRIVLPELEAITCNAMNGGCRIVGFSMGRVTLETVNGDMTLKGCDTEYVSVRATSGDVSLIGGVHNTVSMSSASGDVCIKNITAKSLTATNVSGDIVIENSRADKKTVCRSGGGDITVAYMASDNIECKTISGDVDLKITGNREDYSVRTGTLSGDIRSPLGGEGSKTVTANTLSGDIKVSFT